MDFESKLLVSLLGASPLLSPLRGSFAPSRLFSHHEVVIRHNPIETPSLLLPPLKAKDQNPFTEIKKHIPCVFNILSRSGLDIRK